MKPDPKPGAAMSAQPADPLAPIDAFLTELELRVERAGWEHSHGSLLVVYVNDVTDWLDELKALLPSLRAAITALHGEIGQWKANCEAGDQAYRDMLNTLIAAGIKILIPSDSLPPHWQVAQVVVAAITAREREMEQRLSFQFRCHDCETDTAHRYVLSGPDRILVQCLACAETQCVFEQAAEQRADTLREREASKLAACDVAALCNTRETFRNAEIDRNNPAWTPAYASVRAAVLREIELRERADTLAAELEKARQHVERLTHLADKLHANDTALYGDEAFAVFLQHYHSADMLVRQLARFGVEERVLRRRVEADLTALRQQQAQAQAEIARLRTLLPHLLFADTWRPLSQK